MREGFEVTRAACPGLTIKLCPACIQEAPSSSPHDNWSEEDSCSAEDDPKDPAEDSGSESGGSSDTRGDWTPLRGPRASSHGNRPPPEAQLSDAERPGPQDGGNTTRERGERNPSAVCSGRDLLLNGF